MADKDRIALAPAQVLLETCLSEFAGKLQFHLKVQGVEAKVTGDE